MHTILALSLRGRFTIIIGCGDAWPHASGLKKSKNSNCKSNENK
jgi:hypothetical protein